MLWPDDSSSLAEAISKSRPDVIFHGAGSASVVRSFADTEADRAASVGTWSNLLEAIRLSGMNPLILFPSSAAVYGNPDQLPVCETAPLRPISPYGRHKVECEDLARKYRDEHGLQVVVLRLFSLFGPRQKRLLVRELFEQASSPSAEVSLQGTGNETRDYLSAKDFGSAVVHLAERYRNGGLPSEPWIFNLASGTETSVRELAESIASDCGSAKEVVCRNEVRPGDPVRWVADMTAFRHVCPEWNPRPFGDALQETIATWKQEEGRV